jgi:hypothetical protein
MSVGRTCIWYSPTFSSEWPRVARMKVSSCFPYFIRKHRLMMSSCFFHLKLILIGRISLVHVTELVSCTLSVSATAAVYFATLRLFSACQLFSLPVILRFFLISAFSLWFVLFFCVCLVFLLTFHLWFSLVEIRSRLWQNWRLLRKLYICIFPLEAIFNPLTSVITRWQPCELLRC